MNDKIKNIKLYARENKVPIMMDDGINYLCDFVKKNRIKRILEIGSGIGYSAIRLALVNDQVQIITIEKDRERYLKAIENIKSLKLKKRISIIYMDALEYSTKEKFDLIFIDASKSHNIDFFNRFSKNLAKNGKIVTDNLSFHGLVEDNSLIKTKNQATLVRKIKDYINFLNELEDYNTTIVHVGDTISITKKVDCDEQIIDVSKF